MLKLSVIIAAFNGIKSLEKCLDSLRGQGENSDTEIFVATNFSQGVEELMGEEYPHVKYACFPAETEVPELRSKGIFNTTGEIVALTEDHCYLSDVWCDEIKKAHEFYPIVGGSIENKGKQLLAWAVYFHDYGKYMPPIEAGTVDTLSGVNTSYKRTFLNELKDDFRKDFFETFINLKLISEGEQLYLMPSALVYHSKKYKAKEVRHYFYHGCSYGRMRISGASLTKRMIFALASLILPVLLPLRIANGILKKRRHIKELIFSFPYIVLLMIIWSGGEFCGYLFGGGDRAKKWR